MRVEPGVTDSAPQEIFDAFSSVEFARLLFMEIGEILKAERQLERPAEYLFQAIIQLTNFGYKLLQISTQTCTQNSSLFTTQTLNITPLWAIAFDDLVGVELRLTGVSRNDRTPAQFHQAIAKLQQLASKQIRQAITMRQHLISDLVSAQSPSLLHLQVLVPWPQAPATQTSP